MLLPPGEGVAYPKEPNAIIKTFPTIEKLADYISDVSRDIVRHGWVSETDLISLDEVLTVYEQIQSLVRSSNPPYYGMVTQALLHEFNCPPPRPLVQHFCALKWVLDQDGKHAHSPAWSNFLGIHVKYGRLKVTETWTRDCRDEYFRSATHRDYGLEEALQRADADDEDALLALHRAFPDIADHNPIVRFAVERARERSPEIFEHKRLEAIQSFREEPDRRITRTLRERGFMALNRHLLTQHLQGELKLKELQNIEDDAFEQPSEQVYNTKYIFLRRTYPDLAEEEAQQRQESGPAQSDPESPTTPPPTDRGLGPTDRSAKDDSHLATAPGAREWR